MKDKELILELEQLELDTKFKRLIVNFCYLLRNKYKFQISTDTLLQFFKLQQKLDIFNEEELRLSCKSLFCKSKEQLDIFDEIYDSFFIERVRFVENSNVASVEVKEKALSQAIEKIDSVPIYEKEMRELEADEKVFSALYTNNKEKIDELMDRLVVDEDTKENLYHLLSLDNKSLIVKFQSKDKEEIKNVIKSLKEALSKLMIECLLDDNSPDNLDDFLLVCADTLTRNINFNNYLLKERELQIEKAQSEIEKLLSLNNRAEFTSGVNSVKTHFDIMNKDLNDVSSTEYMELSGYIKSNAIKFKTKIGRNMRKHKTKQFDYATTIKNSVKSYGVPVELSFKKPRIKKTKIVCILDISGSCIKPARMFMNFLYELSSVFKGGVRSFVFVRDIAEVTQLFKDNSTIEAVEKALVSVPNKGTYSDYNNAFAKFDRDFLKHIDKNTIVIFLGDARNNKNASGVQYLEKIKAKSKTTIWLNHEEKSNWNTGDSIMYKYIPYMNEVYSIRKVNDLIKFLDNFNVRK